MIKFNPSVIQMFMFRWTANLYAWRARRRGYSATVTYCGGNWLMLGGRYSVSLKEVEP